MHATVRALLSEVVDYAGLFPPAKLPMDQALSAYLRDRVESVNRWMLGRFVCPSAKLCELLALAKADPRREHLALSVLGQPAANPEQVIEQFHADLQAIADFRSKWGNDAVIDIYEVALPAGSAGVDIAIANLPGLIAELNQNQLRGFLEVPRTPSWQTDIARLCESIAAAEPTLGLKMRCGGLTADAFPSDDQVAYFIDCCRKRQIAWKATAGLHHPRRHWDANLQVWHHGFLNVFVAGLLAVYQLANMDEVREILADRDASTLHFGHDLLGWKNRFCSLPQIEVARQIFTTTFGSCSFAEPCDDLVAMGLLDGE